MDLVSTEFIYDLFIMNKIQMEYNHRSNSIWAFENLEFIGTGGFGLGFGLDICEKGSKISVIISFLIKIKDAFVRMVLFHNNRVVNVVLDSVYENLIFFLLLILRHWSRLGETKYNLFK